MNEFRLVDVFWTFQGEGGRSGHRSLFIRLPFCNLKCPWCDTEFNTYKKYTREDLINIFKQEKKRVVVITGGEPLMNKQIEPLIELLKEYGFYICVETNGTQPIPKGINYVTCSPKRFQEEPYFIHPSILDRESDFFIEYKYVVDDEFDFKVLKRHEDENRVTRIFYLSPEFNNLEKNFRRIEEYIKEHPKWNYSLQTHKFLGIK